MTNIYSLFPTPRPWQPLFYSVSMSSNYSSFFLSVFLSFFLFSISHLSEIIQYLFFFFLSGLFHLAWCLPVFSMLSQMADSPFLWLSNIPSHTCVRACTHTHTHAFFILLCSKHEWGLFVTQHAVGWGAIIFCLVSLREPNLLSFSPLEQEHILQKEVQDSQCPSHLRDLDHQGL